MYSKMINYVLTAFLTVLFSCSHFNSSRKPANEDLFTSIVEQKYIINLYETSPVDILEFKPIVEDAIIQFESKIAPLQSKINISIGAQGCFRVGYNFTNRNVNFCNSKNVLHLGLASKDVIRHELFHAMVCNVHPDLCSETALSSNTTIASHEALADFFANQLEPDNCFGENFYSGQKCIRPYITKTCYALVDGPHQKGNALGSKLVSANITLEQIQSIILQSDFTVSDIFNRIHLKIDDCFDPNTPPLMDYTVANYPMSKLNKYWINNLNPIIISFRFNSILSDRYENITIRWIRAEDNGNSLFEINPTQTPFTFSVTPNSTKGIEKMIAQVFSGEDLIGNMPFYFGVKAIKNQ